MALSENKSPQREIKSLKRKNESLQVEINENFKNFKIVWSEKALWFILGCLTFLTGFSIVWANRDSRNNICSNSDN